MWIASSYKLALYYCDSNLSLVWFGFGSVWVGSGWTRLDLARLEKLTCPCWFSPIFCFPKTPVAIDFSSESIKSTANAIFCFFLFVFSVSGMEHKYLWICKDLKWTQTWHRLFAVQRQAGCEWLVWQHYQVSSRCPCPEDINNILPFIVCTQFKHIFNCVMFIIKCFSFL